MVAPQPAKKDAPHVVFFLCAASRKFVQIVGQSSMMTAGEFRIFGQVETMKIAVIGCAYAVCRPILIIRQNSYLIGMLKFVIIQVFNTMLNRDILQQGRRFKIVLGRAKSCQQVIS